MTFHSELSLNAKMKQAPDLPQKYFYRESDDLRNGVRLRKSEKRVSALENTLLKLGFREKKFVRFAFGVFNRPNRWQTQHRTAAA